MADALLQTLAELRSINATGWRVERAKTFHWTKCFSGL